MSLFLAAFFFVTIQDSEDKKHSVVFVYLARHMTETEIDSKRLKE